MKSEFFGERPPFKAFEVDGFVITQCKRHRGGWICRPDGAFFKFPATRKRKSRKKKLRAAVR